MTHINVGAYVNGQRPATKKALREAIRSIPGAVRFDCTSFTDTRGTIKADIGDIGRDILNVTGPDPYTSRRWYGSVQVRNGKLTVT